LISWFTDAKERNKRWILRTVVSMDRTVDSYQIALEDEIGRWIGFVKALRSDDRQAFEALLDACRNYVSAGSKAVQPLIFESMAFSILLFQQKKIEHISSTLKLIEKTLP